MATKVTYCRICEAACGLLADVEGDSIVALRPDPKHVTSKGFACAKGTRFGAIHHSPDRLNHPLVRHDGRLLRASWAEALEDAGRRLRRIRNRYGPDSVALYIGNPVAFSYAALVLAHGFATGMRSRNQFGSASLDCSNKFVVAKRMFGYAATHPVPDIDHARLALLIGTNPSVSQSSFIQAPRMVERLQAIERKGGKVYVVDPRRTETARRVGTHVPIVPGTDAALILALLNVIFEEQLEDPQALRRHAQGEIRLRKIAERFDPARVSKATGIPASQIREIAREFARAPGSFCHVSTGVNHHKFGNIAYAAKIALELVTGNLDREGGALLPAGAVDLARATRLLGIDSDQAQPSRIGSFAPVLGCLPTSILADEILTEGDGQIRALVVLAGNPLLSAPDSSRLRSALQRLDTLISIDLFINDTASLATHVLPSADWLEREDFPLAQLQLQPSPYLQFVNAVTPPKFERREDWRILADLAAASEIRLWGGLDRAARWALRTVGPKRLLAPLFVRGLGMRARSILKENPHGVRLRRQLPGDFLKRRIRTRSKRVVLCPEEVYARLSELEDTLDAPPQASSRFKLVTRREELGHNSWMHANPSLAFKEHRAWMSVPDAKRLNLRDGDRVRVTSRTGSIELPVATDRGQLPGTLAIAHGYGHEDASGWNVAKARKGANVNELAASGPAALDRLSGMCQFVGVELDVVPIQTRRQQSAEDAGRPRSAK